MSKVIRATTTYTKANSVTVRLTALTRYIRENPSVIQDTRTEFPPVLGAATAKRELPAAKTFFVFLVAAPYNKAKQRLPQLAGSIC